MPLAHNQPQKSGSLYFPLIKSGLTINSEYLNKLIMSTFEILI